MAMIRTVVAMLIGGFIVFLVINPVIMVQYPLLLVAALLVAGLGGWMLRRKPPGRKSAPEGQQR